MPDTTAIKTINNSTLKDSFIDLILRVFKINGLETLKNKPAASVDLSPINQRLQALGSKVDNFSNRISDYKMLEMVRW
ncbi:hypothetical protein PPA191_gp03 [Liberibacter phage P-PA19-1]|nr:hypothetical protein PPA191_gp03 [Liberibacter phage P-PA19-1]